MRFNVNKRQWLDTAFTLLLLLFSATSLYAQPANDSCAVARLINLPINFGSPVSYQGHNIGASPEIPASIEANCTPGGIFSGLGADVWYTFTPDRNMCVRIEVNGLLEPEFSVRDGNSCTQTQEIACATSGNGSVQEVVSLRLGNTYYLRVSGAYYSDQGYFNLTMTRVGCPSDDPCMISDYLSTLPEPEVAFFNGEYFDYYLPGTTVEFCYSVDEWQPLAANWIHAIEIDLGEAWDANSLVPIFPFSCNGEGQWDWYDFWISCNTFEEFGPGFAYDSSNGLGCGGFPGDGDPGNNWGDGPNQCQPIVFCWFVTVKSCEQLAMDPQSDLSIDITVLADSESGSYTQFACDQFVDEEIELITFLCSDVPPQPGCYPQEPFIEVFPVSCQGEMDGSFTVDNVDTDSTSNILIYNLNDQLIEAFLDVELPFTIPEILDTGFYGVVLETQGLDDQGFCEGALLTIIKVGAPFETFARIAANQDCATDSLRLVARVWPDTLEGFSYLWGGPNDFFSTDASPVVTENGEYILTTIRDGCRVSDTVNVVFQAALALDIDYASFPPCPGDELVLSASGAPSSSDYQWLLPPGSTLQPPLYDPGLDRWNFGPLDGTSTLQLVGFSSLGCPDTISFTAVPADTPVLNYTATVPNCNQVGVTVNVDLDTDPLQIEWLDNNSAFNPRSFTGIAAGESLVVSLLLTNTSGCTTEETITLIGPGLSMSADETVLCPGETAILTASPADTYTWNTGETTSSIVVSPTASTSEVYTVNSTDVYGCEHTASIEVETLPVVDAGFSISGTDLSYQFQPNAPDHPDLSYWWDFGDGTFSSNYFPTHTYSVGSSYEVILTITGSCGDDTSSQTLTLTSAPSVGFSSSTTNGCSPFSVNFSNESINADTYSWSFPGGVPATSTAEEPTVVYLEPGVYPVSLVGTNSVGSDTSSVEEYITVQASVTGSFTYSTDLLQADFNSEINDATTILWDFGDGDTSTVPNPIHTYEIGGEYIVQLTITNECSSITITETVVVERPIPNVAFTTTNERTGCTPLEITFINQSENALTYQWTFPGGEPESSTEVNPTVVYSSPGIYFVQLNAVNESGGNALVAESYVEVLASPSGSFTYDSEELLVNFLATAENTDTYHWDFGDGDSSAEPGPMHEYAGNGTYQVRLELINDCDTVLITEEISVMRALPVASFSTDSQTNGCAPLTVTFINESTNADSYLWTFPGGDPATSQEVNPTVTYETAGVFPVELVASNETGGAQLVLTEFVEVLGLPFATLEYSVEELEVSFSADGVDADNYFWQFGDSNSSMEQNPTHTYTEPGIYTVTLSVQNQCGTVVIEETIEPMITDVDTPGEEEQDWSIYPNPNDGKMSITFSGWDGHQLVQLSVYNALGELLHQKSANVNDQNTEELSLQLPSGVYWLKVEDSTGIERRAKMFIVQ